MLTVDRKACGFSLFADVRKDLVLPFKLERKFIRVVQIDSEEAIPNPFAPNGGQHFAVKVEGDFLRACSNMDQLLRKIDARDIGDLVRRFASHEKLRYRRLVRKTQETSREIEKNFRVNACEYFTK